MSKNLPLSFRWDRFGRADVCQRNFVQYAVRYNGYFNGQKTDKPYFVEVWDKKACDIVSTDRTRRFATKDEAKAFLQSVYDGEIRVDVLKDEVDQIMGAEQARYDAMITAEVDHFRDVLNLHGVFLDDFVSVLEAWEKLHADAQAALYRDAKGGSE